jgi:hypothetical protein
MTLTSGITAFNVKLLDNSGLTVNAVVSELVIGITANKAFAQVGVYGTGGTAVGVTGNIGIGATEMITISGSAAMTGSVYLINTDVYQHNGVAVFGTGGSSVSGDVGVTGSVAVDHRSVIGISGGITVDVMPTLVVAVPSGITSGWISSGLGGGITLDPHGLSSGVRVQAFSTGSTSEYVFVSYGTGGHATAAGYALREFDSIFIEIDNTSKVTIRSDNSAAQIRYIGS